MCDGILVNGDLCIPIYRYPIAWPPHRPDPPERFEREIEDLSTIATISQAISHLRNDDIRGQLGKAVQAAFSIAARQLPPGVTLGDGLVKAPQHG